MILTQKEPALYHTPASVLPVPVGGSVSAGDPFVVGDSIVETLTYSSTYLEYMVSSQLEDSVATVETPAIFSMEGSRATRIAPGVGRLRIDYGGYAESLSLDFRGVSDYQSDRLIGFTSGTVGAIALGVALALAVSEPDMHYYDSPTYVEGLARNPDCWAAAFDLSGVPVVHLSGGFKGGGALITPRHFICSHHYLPTNRVGSVLKFVAADGTLVTCTVIGQTTGSANGLKTNTTINVGDLAVLLLDSDVPTGVKIYPVAGDWVSKIELLSVDGSFGTYHYEDACPFILLDQERRVGLSVRSEISTTRGLVPGTLISIGSGISYEPYAHGGRFSTGRYAYASTVLEIVGIKGDSGSPVFVPLPGPSLALYTVMSTPSSGPVIHESIANAMIREVDARYGITTGYTVTVAPDPSLA
jgi:hypothetical protein